MGRPFPNPGNVIYNGFVFPSAFQSSVRIRPVLTSDGRTIKYREYHLHIETVVVSDDFLSGSANAANLGFTLAPGAPVDLAMQTVRNRLTVNGKPLKWTNLGIGPDLLVSAAGLNSSAVGNDQWSVQGVYPDVAFGPRVENFEWSSLGDNRAALVAWDCVVTLACEDTFKSGSANSQLNLFGEFCYAFSFHIDSLGLTTRTINGSAETAVYRTDTKGITATADALRPLIRFPLIQGFAREQTWTASADKRRLEFSITDRELPSENALFPGCVRMDVRHRMATGLGANGGGFRLWNSTIAGHIELAPGIARSNAWLAFLVILNDRFSQSGGFVNPDAADEAQGLTYISQIEIEESIFTRQFYFSVTYGITARLKNILAAAGLWRPVPNQWADWVVSMGVDPETGQLLPKSTYGPLGNTGLAHSAQDDVIVDFCEPFEFPAVANYSPPSKSSVYQALQPECPPPQESSWIRFNYRVDIVRETGIIVHREIGDGDSTQSTEISPGAEDSAPIFGYSPPAGGASLSPSGPGSLRIQNTGASLVRLVLSGSAVRVGWRITPPKIVLIGAVPAVLEDEDVTDNELTGYTGDCPVYHMRWNRTYVAYNPQGKIEIDGIPERFQDTPVEDEP